MRFFLPEAKICELPPSHIWYPISQMIFSPATSPRYPKKARILRFNPHVNRMSENRDLTLRSRTYGNTCTQYDLRMKRPKSLPPAIYLSCYFLAFFKVPHTNVMRNNIVVCLSVLYTRNGYPDPVYMKRVLHELGARGLHWSSCRAAMISWHLFNYRYYYY